MVEQWSKNQEIFDEKLEKLESQSMKKVVHHLQGDKFTRTWDVIRVYWSYNKKIGG